MASARACFITPENSRSVISTLVSAWSRVKAMIAASRRVFSVFSTAPAMGTPKWHSSMAGVLASMTVTVSFLPTPWAARALARRRALA